MSEPSGETSVDRNTEGNFDLPLLDTDAEVPLCSARNTVCSGPIRQCLVEDVGWVFLEDCGTQALCTQDACLEPACLPGQRRCAGARIEECNLARDGFQPLVGSLNGGVCATPELCNEALGVCDPPVCQVGERRCKQAQLEECSPSRKDFRVVETCASATFCVELAGDVRCDPPVCLPGTTACDDDDVVSCNPEGTAFVLLERCRGFDNCEVIDAVASCQ